MSAIADGPDHKSRCSWAFAAPEFLAYHDTEWGFPVADSRRLYEKLCLEGFQAGLSWRTILVKRENFRAAFQGFDFNRVASFDESDVERLLGDAGIVRHRGKIEAAINNARRAVELVESGRSLAALAWSYESEATELAPPLTVSTSPASVALSKELGRQGWRFVGPTTVYSFMQATGIVNDHAEGCVIRDEVRRRRDGFSRPTA
jgi:DNA-3-methyladenine glycosylase I